MYKEKEFNQNEKGEIKLQLLAKKLSTFIKEFDELTEENKKYIIEKIYQDNLWELRELYYVLNYYMGWDIDLKEDL